MQNDSHTETPFTGAVEKKVHSHRKTRAVKRRKAAKNTIYTMELAVYIDNPLVSHVKERYPSADPKKKAKEIVMTLLNVVSTVTPIQ